MVAFPHVPLEPSAAQKARLRRFNVSACADVHCHCLPGLDDGPPTMADAVALCRALVNDGITVVVATPHQMGRYDGANEPTKIRSAVKELSEILAAEKIFLGVVPGADIRIDERLGPMLDNDQISTIADARKYLLLELPNDTLINPIGIIGELVSRGVTPIITHPERHPILAGRPDSAVAWVEAGAIFQVTAASLTGGFGPIAEKSAWVWMEQGLVQLIATDAHDVRRRPPMLTGAIDKISARMTHITARRLCLENPLRIVRGEALTFPRPRLRDSRGGNR